jgi:hypothetical protein
VDEGRIKLYAVPLILASVFCFYQAIFAAPSFRSIASLGEKDNFGRVRVRGEVLSVRVFTDKYQRGTSIVLGLGALGEGDAGSAGKAGEIRLKADGKVGHEIKTGGRVPSIGDILDVSASVFAGRGYRLLSLNSSHNLKVVGATDNKVVYTETTVAKVLADPEAFRDKAIALPRARLAKRLGRFHLGVAGEDESKLLRVYGEKPQFYRPDDVVSVRGRWTQFKKGSPWELKVDRQDPSGFVVLEKSEKPTFERDDPKPAPAKVVTIAEVLANPEQFKGQRIKVERAEVAAVSNRRSMDVRDEAGADTLAVFGIDPWRNEPGNIVSVSGKLSLYEKANRWEIKVDRKARGVRTLEKANPDRKKATMAQLLATPADYEGTKIVVYEALVTAIVDENSFRVGDPAESEAAPASASTTASVVSSGTPAGSISVTGSSTEKLTAGARVKLRGEFVKPADGAEWQIRVAERDLGAVRFVSSKRSTDGAGG